jgi:hypothetical protein
LISWRIPNQSKQRSIGSLKAQIEHHWQFVNLCRRLRGYNVEACIGRVFVLDYPTHIVNLGSRHKAHGERWHPILALPAEIEFSMKNIETAAHRVLRPGVLPSWWMSRVYPNSSRPKAPSVTDT